MSEPQYNDSAKRLIGLRQRIIGELMEHPCFKSLIEELKNRRPTVPYWNPEVDNTEQLKFASAQQKWHDVMMAIINPNQKYEKGTANERVEPSDR